MVLHARVSVCATAKHILCKFRNIHLHYKNYNLKRPSPWLVWLQLSLPSRKSIEVPPQWIMDKVYLSTGSLKPSSLRNEYLVSRKSLVHDSVETWWKINTKPAMSVVIATINALELYKHIDTHTHREIDKQSHCDTPLTQSRSTQLSVVAVSGRLRLDSVCLETIDGCTHGVEWTWWTYHSRLVLKFGRLSISSSRLTDSRTLEFRPDRVWGATFEISARAGSFDWSVVHEGLNLVNLVSVDSTDFSRFLPSWCFPAFRNFEDGR